MKMTDLFLQQLERETPGSRKALEQVPLDRPDWKPHPRSMPLGYLATLVAMMPSWIAYTINQDELDINPPKGSEHKPAAWTTTRELLDFHEDCISKAREALRGTNDEHLLTSWRLLASGKVVAEDPRYMVIAQTYTHLAHHRGQLTVYLRLNDLKVPAIYGPSADDSNFA